MVIIVINSHFVAYNLEAIFIPYKSLSQFPSRSVPPKYVQSIFLKVGFVTYKSNSKVEESNNIPKMFHLPSTVLEPP